jgi:hypothetical protein
MKIHLTEAHSEIITTTTSLLPGHFAAHRADGADDAARRADCVRVDPTRAQQENQERVLMERNRLSASAALVIDRLQFNLRTDRQPE